MGEISFWFWRPFVQAEQRAGDTCIQIYISQFRHVQMPVSAFVFPVATKKKKSCWHAACLRGVIHHYWRKESQNEIFTRAFVFVTLIFTVLAHQNTSAPRKVFTSKTRIFAYIWHRRESIPFSAG